MTEAKFQEKFNRWLRYRYEDTSAFELKVAKNGKLYLKDIKEHQIQALYSVKNGKLIYKIPDVGNFKKPFDCFIFSRNPNAFLVIFFEKSKQFFLIDINILMGFLSTGQKYIDTEIADFLGIHRSFE